MESGSWYSGMSNGLAGAADAAVLHNNDVQQLVLAKLAQERGHQLAGAGSDTAGRHTDDNADALVFTAKVYLAQRLLTDRFQISNGLHEYLHLHGLLMV